MTREIYEAMKAHISVLSRDEYDRMSREAGDEIVLEPEDLTIYRFNNEGLNDGLDYLDEGYADPIVHAMKTRNMWNVCQRFYGFLRAWHGTGIDERLLKSVSNI